MAGESRRPSLLKRQYYIKPEFQRGFILVFMGVILVGGLISLGLIYYSTQDSLTSTFVHSRLRVEPTGMAIFPAVLAVILGTTLVLGLLALGLTLLTSHRIAGPMYRFEKDIQRMAKGDLAHRVRIRRGDQFQDMAHSLNTMARELGDGVSHIIQDMDALAGRGDTPPGIQAELTQLADRARGRFRV